MAVLGGMAPKRLWNVYMKHLNQSPISTKIFTSVAAATLGDCIAQYASRPRGTEAASWEYDWPRTFRFCLFNGGFMAPLGHYYYNRLDRVVMPHAPTTMKAVASKIGIDQLIFAPICTAIFYAFKCVTENRPREFPQELSVKWGPTVLAGYKLWPAAHVINFLFVPTSQRILFANVVSVAGTYILSRAAAGDLTSKNKGEGKRVVTEILFDGVQFETSEVKTE